jgi:hypothetical protein
LAGFENSSAPCEEEPDRGLWIEELGLHDAVELVELAEDGVVFDDGLRERFCLDLLLDISAKPISQNQMLTDSRWSGLKDESCCAILVIIE